MESANLNLDLDHLINNKLNKHKHFIRIAPHLAAKLGKDNIVYYQVSYTVQREQIKTALLNSAYLQPNQALAACWEIVGTALKRGEPLTKKENIVIAYQHIALNEITRETTVYGAFHQWVKAHPKQMCKYKNNIRSFILPNIGTEFVHGLNIIKLKDLIEPLELRGRSVPHSTYQAVRTMFKWCKEREIISHHCCTPKDWTEITGKKQTRIPRKPLTVEEMVSLLDHVRNPTTFAEWVCLMMISMFCRPSEAVRSTGKNFFMDDGTLIWSLEPEQVKDKHRTHPFERPIDSPTLQKLIMERCHTKTKRLTGRKITPNHQSVVIKELMQSIGIDKTAYCIRHGVKYCSTERANVPVFEANMLMMHKIESSISAGYSGTSQNIKAKQQALKIWHEWLDSKLIERGKAPFYYPNHI